jgi:hypothetical protein
MEVHVSITDATAEAAALAVVLAVLSAAAASVLICCRRGEAPGPNELKH